MPSQCTAPCRHAISSACMKDRCGRQLMTLIFLRSFQKKLLSPTLLFHLDGHQALPVTCFHFSAACPCGYLH